uniref:Uncharacterized protein n=1 Tax=Arundo donax TaxID=35708 RepID=A0A0A9GUU6_ARUDO
MVVTFTTLDKRTSVRGGDSKITPCCSRKKNSMLSSIGLMAAIASSMATMAALEGMASTAATTTALWQAQKAPMQQQPAQGQVPWQPEP